MAWNKNVEVIAGFPTVVSAIVPTDLCDFIEFIEKQHTMINELLLQAGALLFRNFSVRSAADFSHVVTKLRLGKCVNYIGGDSPRDKVADNVYTSTEAPPSFHIPLHQELSFIKNHPRHIYFYCDIAPSDGGETIIGDARQIYRRLASRVLDKFCSRDLIYTSRYYYQSRLMQLMNRWQRSHKSWIEVFETHEKSEVERQCIENNFSWQWLAKGWLQIEQIRPSTLEHPLTGDRVWFNQAHLYNFNPRLLGIKKYIGAKIFYIRKSTRLHEVRFSDNTKIDRGDLYHIMDVLEKNTVKFSWQGGDVLVLDNILAMHGRAPFVGKRRILTAMTT